MSAFQAILTKQGCAMRSIERALPNFKKLGRDKMTAAVTTSRIQTLKELFIESQMLNAELHHIADEKEKAGTLYFVEDHFAKCETIYNETMDFMAELLANLTQLRQPSLAGNLTTTATTSRPGGHLPRLQMPTFDGALEIWESFRDQFASMVINNHNLSNVEKMQYLCLALKNEAKAAIMHLPITEENFEIAWNIIQSRYANQRRLIATHLHALFSLATVSSESPKELRHLRDRLNGSIQALKNLNRPVDTWSDMLVFLGVQRLDRSSRKAWELKLGTSTEFPAYTTFDEFLDSRIRALEFITPPLKEKSSDLPVKSMKQKFISAHAATAIAIICPICKGSHLIYKCDQFLAKSPQERYNFIKSQRRCLNCFSVKHDGAQCRSAHNCKECRQRHHTLLHFPSKFGNQNNGDLKDAASLEKAADELSTHLVTKPCTNHFVLLSTARVHVYSTSGHPVKVRALLDQGSVATLITADLSRRLQLQRDPHSICVTGIGSSVSTSKHSAIVRFSSTDEVEPAYSTTAIILQNITRYTPQSTLRITNLDYLAGLKLADGDPMSSDPIDLLIGADLYGQLLTGELRRRANNEPIAQSTTLGWILSGPTTPSSLPPRVEVNHCAVFERLDESIRKFWEIETISEKAALSIDDEKCEIHFRKTHSRSATGRYIVRLPFKTDQPLLGNSRSAAIRHLVQLENRFRRDKTLAIEYKAFMREYESLGHMRRVESRSPTERAFGYYIPHHAVRRDHSETTRMRVVFNASRKTTNGKSLNDLLLSGPKLQQDLTAILMRWRQYEFVYTADVAKMYRQILMHNNDIDFQRILWRDNPNEPISEYKLLTVTYGTTSAPYQAIRVLQQLAHDEKGKFPLATPIIIDQTYVDDCLFGSDDPTQLRTQRDQLIQLLKKGGFHLRKWASNAPALLADIDPSDHGLAGGKDFKNGETLSVLGIAWNPLQDKFCIKSVAIPELPRTKRAILSAISMLFDPLGWIAPIVVTAKVLMQQLWQERCDWDDEAPSEILDKWSVFCAQLPRVNELSIPRKLASGTIVRRELHGFADASIKAYAAIVYQRSIKNDGTVEIGILTAKTRVAPVKTISVPRLELSAALLLAKLLRTVQNAVQLHKFNVVCWSDSSITLWWLTKSPNQLKTFIANRVTKIHEALPDASWRYVPTDENPADCASRGLLPLELGNHPLWWTGPPWLRKQDATWPKSIPSLPPDTCREERSTIPSCVIANNQQWSLAKRYSSWPKLLRVTAYVLRFVVVARKHDRKNSKRNHPISKLPLVLLPEEISKAKIFWLKTMQAETFHSERSQLLNKRPLSKTSAIGSLMPFIDNDGLIRARGRLRNSSLSIGEKYPIILRSHELLTLIIRHAHLQTLHGGSQLTLSVLRREYWILRARSTVRTVLYKCVPCTRERAEIPTELMGDLPTARVTPESRAFTHTGVDYAGPISIRTTPGRGHKTHKAYIAIFVCMAVKAIHIELVNDYSANAFVAAYHRFISRRGRPKAMYSDNGTTFHGANRELSTAIKLAAQSVDFVNSTAVSGLQWHFLPPAAPHFGGLWEAAVKSVKHHVKRCIGSHTLTSEEMTTLLCRVEACLNSRPISAVSDNIDDYQVLTPGHFLIGTAIVAEPQPSVLNLTENRLSRWQLVQRITENIWKAWSNDYLHTLHQRPKWRSIQSLAKVGQIVLLRNAGMPPSMWELGRIIACHPGEDSLTRVVTIKTSKSVYKRPIAKVCFLPVSINEDKTNSNPSALSTTTQTIK
ncbi:uncharacterized protein LOC143220175 [Lasioglossum baleicum]|uniref:uncharacterized protein LOC143220175 n=1 Tax=Lasioglossum baleicum TaxID=434251 RepID=UPI003FCEDA56